MPLGLIYLTKLYSQILDCPGDTSQFLTVQSRLSASCTIRVIAVEVADLQQS